MGKKDKDNDGTRLKELDLGQLLFKANGNNYFVESHISPARYKQMELLSIEIGFGQVYKSIYDGFEEIRKHLNETDWVSAAIVANNKMEQIENIEGNHNAILRYCAMFINREGEDRRIVDDIVINEKIEDWIKEGITQDSFFVLAVNMVNGLKKNYEKYTLDIS